MAGPDLSVVIVSYNVRQHLGRCLEALHAALVAAKLEAETWVVDNASSDGSADLVETAFPWVNLIREPTNRGFAAANNLALRQASGRYFLLVNPDAELIGNALGELLQTLERPEAGACGPALRYADGRFQHAAFRFPTLAMAFLDFFPLNHRLLHSSLNGRYSRQLYQAGQPFKVDHVLGACLMVKGEAAARIGLLDEGFFMYCEEIDWCWRLRQAGYRVYCVPQAEVVHHEAQSTRQFREEMFLALWRARLRLFGKHYRPGYRLLARLILLLGALRLGATGRPAERRAARRVARLALGV